MKKQVATTATMASQRPTAWSTSLKSTCIAAKPMAVDSTGATTVKGSPVTFMMSPAVIGNTGKKAHGFMSMPPQPTRGSTAG